jgi:branched-subunit amino acid aminotransferase/4-amino-4-deoxychorismate lyase
MPSLSSCQTPRWSVCIHSRFAHALSHCSYGLIECAADVAFLGASPLDVSNAQSAIGWLPISCFVIVHLHGRLVPAAQASINPFDRGFLMGDAIYEGLRAFRGRIVGLQAHIDRMTRSLAEARIPWDPRQLGPLSQALLEANGLADAFVYWQVTRGTPTPEMPLRTRMPPKGLAPTVFGYCSPQPALETFVTPKELRVAIRPDLRWHRGHVKSTSLMGNVISCVEADEAGASDAMLVRGLDERGDEALVSEGSATNLIAAVPTLSDPRRIELVTPDPLHSDRRRPCPVLRRQRQAGRLLLCPLLRLQIEQVAT